MRTVLKYVGVFLLLQYVAALAMLLLVFVCRAWGGANDVWQSESPAVMLLSAFMGFLWIVLYLWKVDGRRAFVRSAHRLSFGGWIEVVVLSLSAVVVIEWATLPFSFLPDWGNEGMESILQTGVPGILLAVVMGPLVEEWMFRGLITRQLLGCYSVGRALCLSALLFGFAHLNPAQIPSAVLGGWLLAWLYHRTQSLLPGLIFHVLNNGISFYAYMAHPDAASLQSVMSHASYCLLLSSCLVLLACAFWRLKLRTSRK